MLHSIVDRVNRWHDKRHLYKREIQMNLKIRNVIYHPGTFQWDYGEVQQPTNDTMIDNQKAIFSIRK